LGAVIGVMDNPGAGAPPPYRHIQGIDNEFRSEMIRNRPADHPSELGIDDHSEIRLASPGGVFGDISGPEPVRDIDSAVGQHDLTGWVQG